jgi:hypothetical protein
VVEVEEEEIVFMDTVTQEEMVIVEEADLAEETPMERAKKLSKSGTRYQLRTSKKSKKMN